MNEEDTMKLIRDYTVDEKDLTPADEPEITVRGQRVKGFYKDHGNGPAERYERVSDNSASASGRTIAVKWFKLV